MRHRGILRGIFALFFVIFLFAQHPVHAETDYKLVKGEITGINEKTLQIETQESLSVGDKLTLVRGGETVAVCEVVKIKGSTVTVEILEQYLEPDFDDTIMKVVEVKPPAEEKPEIKTEETKPEETVKPETLAEIASVTPAETKKAETVAPVTPIATEKIVAILPIENLTANEDAPKTIHNLIEKTLLKRGYAVASQNDVNWLIKEKGLSNLYAVSNDEVSWIGKELKAQFVLRIRLEESWTLGYGHPVLFPFYSSRRMARTTITLSLFDVASGKYVFEKQTSRLAGSSKILNFLHLTLFDIIIYPSKKLRAQSLTSTIASLTKDLTVALP